MTVRTVLVCLLLVASPAPAQDWLADALSRAEQAVDRASQIAGAALPEQLRPALRDALAPLPASQVTAAVRVAAPHFPLSREGSRLRIPLVLDFEAPIFDIPMNRFEPGPSADAAVTPLPGLLGAFSERLRRMPSAAYDWAFPHVYSLVTEKELAYAAAGRYARPDIVKLEVGQFYEVYSANAARWMSGREAEPAWEAAARLSRELKGDGPQPARDRAAALAVVLASMYAHIAVDLPRCLMLVRYTALVTTEELERDFFAMSPLFDEVSRQIVAEAEMVPGFVRKLPPLLRAIVFAAGPKGTVRMLRRYAWERFEWNARRNRHREELRALGASDSFTPLASFGAGSSR